MKAILDEVNKLIEQVSQQTLYLQLEQRNYDFNTGYVAAMEIVKRLITKEVKRQERGDDSS